MAWLRETTTITDRKMSSRPDSCEGSILILGAAQGIGAAVAGKLAETAVARKLVLADINVEKAQALATDLQASGVHALTRRVDLGDTATIADLVEEFDDVDRLALVASILEHHPTLDTTPEMFERVMRVNMIGSFYAAQAVARRLIQRQREGAICAVTSIGARHPQRDLAAYCASKAALTSALRVLGLSTSAHGVRINFVARGATRTAMMRTDPQTLIRTLPILIGRVNEPEDVAGAVVFMLSPESRMITLRERAVRAMSAACGIRSVAQINQTFELYVL
ncbi:SDR family NAD(P)-dependent oxidoreductase [Paraburkholderia ferrariae]|jgi:NAD(P)-dependent dehydrogenase (short-subunit alcohol dehydrogenase family)|uniref:SDR family NAD(P)-dependent oxidoreductase n=1 Tax=Paraburkholderia ferrariae TaxID=386056 RepID=UPI0006939B0A|nr:SDR family oxidoreductase [Paraburkholderia ferrariae]